MIGGTWRYLLREIETSRIAAGARGAKCEARSAGREENGDERTLRVLLSKAKEDASECTRRHWCAAVDIPVACRGGIYARHKLGESCCRDLSNGLCFVDGCGSGAWAERRRRRLKRRRGGARLFATAGPGDGGVAAEAIAGASAGIEYAGEGVENAAAVRAGGSGGVAKGIGRGKITTAGDERAGEQWSGGASFAGKHNAGSAGCDINASVNRRTNYKTGRKPTVGGSEGCGAEPDEGGKFIEIPRAVVGDG